MTAEREKLKEALEGRHLKGWRPFLFWLKREGAQLLPREPATRVSPLLWLGVNFEEMGVNG